MKFVSETNFLKYKLLLGGRPAEFLDGKARKGLGKKTNLFYKNQIKKLNFCIELLSLCNLGLTKECEI